MISRLSIPRKYTEVTPRSACPSCLCMTVIGIPSRAISTVSMPELVRTEPPADTGTDGGHSQLLPRSRRSPRPARRRTMQHAQRSAHRKRRAQLHPRPQLLLPPAIHPDLAAPSALAMTHQNRTADRVKIALGERERLRDPQPRSPQHDDQSAHPNALRAFPGAPHHRDDLLDTRRIRRIAKTLIPRRPPRVEPRHRRRRPTTPSSIQQDRLHHTLLHGRQRSSHRPTGHHRQQLPPTGLARPSRRSHANAEGTFRPASDEKRK